MQKLTMLTLVTVALLSLAGCNRGWPRWLCRGDDCGTCGGFSGSMSSPGLLAPTYVPSATELPGPVGTPAG